MRKYIPLHILILVTGLIVVFLLGSLGRTDAASRKAPMDEFTPIRVESPRPEPTTDEVEIPRPMSPKIFVPSPDVLDEGLTLIDRLRRQFATAVEQNNGEEALAIFLNLVSQRAKGHPFAVEAGNIILSRNQDEIPLVDIRRFMAAFGTGSETGELLMYALENGEAPARFRAFAALQLGAVLPGKSAVAVYGRLLKGERDFRVVAMMARSLATIHRPDVLGSLETAHAWNRNPACRAQIVLKVASLPTPDRWTSLDRMAQVESNSRLREEIWKKIEAGTAPVGGFRLTGVRPGSDSARIGLQKGDIVVRFNGVSVDSSSVLAKEIVLASDLSNVPVDVYREGVTFTVIASPKNFGLKGRQVDARF